MKLKQLDCKTFTTKTDIITYLIPGLSEDIAVLEVKIIDDKYSTSSIKKVLKDKKLKILKQCQPYFVKPKFFDIIKTKNPYQLKGPNLDDFIIKNLYDNDDCSADNLIWFYYPGNLLFNSHGNPISIPFYYDYIGTPFSNEYCKLGDLLKYLNAHPWVINKEDLFIQNIPYYNRRKNHNKHLGNIYILPDQKTLDKIWEAYEGGDKFFSLREIICSWAFMANPDAFQDWLGISPFLKQPVHQLTQHD